MKQVGILEEWPYVTTAQWDLVNAILYGGGFVGIPLGVAASHYLGKPARAPPPRPARDGYARWSRGGLLRRHQVLSIVALRSSASGALGVTAGATVTRCRGRGDPVLIATPRHRCSRR